MPVPLFSLDRPLSSADLTTYDPALRELQGNILKSHGRNETVSIFLSFRSGRVVKARNFIRAMAARVTSAREQQDQALNFNNLGRNELFTGLWLSAEGYRFLGHDTRGFETSFHWGMQSAAGTVLDDPPVARWEAKFRRPIHALLTFAHADAAEVRRESGAVRRELAGTATVSWEFGRAMRDGRQAFEHFGFVDGVSQPLFFEKDLAGVTVSQWDPSAGPNLVVLRDPLALSDAECGSYFVFRKLEQNVKGFRRRLKDLATMLQVPPETAGAMIMGRFEDGTPIATRARMNGRTENGFNYRADPQGHRCPLFSHVRKTNPRGDRALRRHRIARRGITYGDPTPRGGAETLWPERGVGVLFQCCQANISLQFENIHVLWANQQNFIVPGVGRDAVISQGGATQVEVPAGRGSSRRVPFAFGEFVRMLGGEYFFAPAKSVLGRL